MFEDCPDLSVGCIRELDRIEIRYLKAAHSLGRSADTSDEGSEQEQRADPAAAAVTQEKSPTHGGASPSGSSTMHPTPLLGFASAASPPRSPSWKKISAPGYPSNRVFCGC
ncbi:hypothetical protein ACIF8T_39740 [Streptomyces sp. NPDC085946]|uniref:hypothetical protein n=1 Tax=Streptomyces sp. NPDC085946 TaxID=3365744 RepID=UPI0037D858F4